MGKIIETVVRLVLAGKRAYTRKWSFFGLFVMAFLGSVLTLGTLDLLPDTASVSVVTASSTDSALSANASKPITAIELPTKIEISSIGLATTIENPTMTNVEVLNRGLLFGAVRYPTSAKLGEVGNIVLFGHSSYLPVVNNQAYKTFNEIQKLANGDVITVYSSDAVYTYRVRSVVEEKADNNTAIPLLVSGKMLTLVTCNSFGTKSDRFVVTADFVESHAVSG